MKSPQEILLARHRAAEPKLDTIREAALAAVSDRRTSNQSSTSVTDHNEINFWRELFSFRWPAWAPFAAVWIVVFALKFSTPDEARNGREAAAPTPEVIAAVRQQKLLFAELAGIAPASEPKSSKPLSPRPRSERPRKSSIG